MATAPYTILKDGVHIKLIEWNLTHANDVGAPFKFSGYYPGKSIQAFGTFDSGTVKAQGTNEDDAAPSNYFDLQDVEGAAIGITAAGGVDILENTYQIRPVITGDSGSADVTVLVCFKG